MNTPKIQVILGSTRNGRQGEKVARFFMNAVKDNQSAQVELVDLVQFDLPLFQDEGIPMMREGAHPDARVQMWLDKVSQADAYVIVTPEYNASVPAALKNALDFGYKEWNNKFVGFVSYGALTGGVRAVEHLRLITAHLKMFGIFEKITIPNIWSAFDAEGNLSHGEDVAKTANSMINELAKHATAEKLIASGSWQAMQNVLQEEKVTTE